MSQALPEKNFQWCTQEEMDRIVWRDADDKLPFGFIVECDLEYPAVLHDFHNDYPLATERVNIQVEMLGETQIELSRHYARNRAGTNVKLVPHLMKKEKYVTHSLVLK